MDFSADDRAYLWFADAKMSGKTVHALLQIYHSPRAVWEQFEQAKALHLTPKQAELLEKSRQYLEQTMEMLASSDVHMLTERHEQFPDRLRLINDAPYALFCKGDLGLLESRSIAVVGTRKPSYYGRKIARQLAEQFGGLGICVVSGFAMGIDTYAHQAAFATKGRTCAVCGCGLNIEYPADNHKLREDILSHDGLLISEYTLDTVPVSYHFPFRNRIISALSDIVFFVEGGLKSGGMHTVNRVIEQNKIVYAVPGNIDQELSQGPNHLIAMGEAKFYHLFEDALEDLQLADKAIAVPAAGSDSRADELDGIQLDIYKLLKLAPRSFDEMVELLKKAPDEVQVAVGYLEILDYIVRVGGNTYQVR